MLCNVPPPCQSAPTPQNSKIEKAFLFDVARKLYVAADSSPFGLRSFELASETLDVFFDLQSIYRRRRGAAAAAAVEGSLLARGELRLSNGITVGCSQISAHLALVYLANGDAISNPTTSTSRPEILQHNVSVARDAIVKVLAVGD